VVGYRHEMIREHLQRYPEFTVTWVDNPDYADTNTANSLWLARREMTDDFLYLNGDVLFHPELVRRLVAAPSLNPLAVERKRCGEEEVKVLLDGARVTAIGKEINPAEAYGEFIGVAKFTGAIGSLFGATLEEVVLRDKLVKNYFETAVDRMTDKTIFTALDVSDLPCIEIDFPEDLERAKNVILPLLF